MPVNPDSFLTARSIFPWKPLLVLHLLFLGLAMYLGHSVTKDSAEYLQQADNIFHRASVYCGDLDQPLQPELFNRRPPLYAVWLMLTGSIGSWAVWTLVLQCILSMFNAFLVFAMAQSFVVLKQQQRWLYLLPLLFFPSQLIYANLIMSEILLQTTLLLILYFLLRWLRAKKTIDLFLFQLMLVLAMLIKPVAYPFALVSFVLLAFWLLRKQLTVPQFFTSLIPLAVLFLVFNIHFQRSGIPEFSSIQRDVRLNYDMQKLLNRRMSFQASVDSIRYLQEQTEKLPYPLRVRVQQAQIEKWIAADKWGFVMIRMEGIGRFFMDAGRWDWDTFIHGWQKAGDHFYHKAGTERWLMSGMMLLSWIGNLLLLYAMVQLYRNQQIEAKEKWTILGMILLLALFTGASGAARFRVPVFPMQWLCWLVLVSGNAKQEQEAKYYQPKA